MPDNPPAKSLDVLLDVFAVRVTNTIGYLNAKQHTSAAMFMSESRAAIHQFCQEAIERERDAMRAEIQRLVRPLDESKNLVRDNAWNCPLLCMLDWLDLHARSTTPLPEGETT